MRSSLVLFTLAFMSPVAFAQPGQFTKTDDAPTAAQQVRKTILDFANNISPSGFLNAQVDIYGARFGFFGANVWSREFAEKFPFDIVLTDVSQPLITGDTATATISYSLVSRKVFETTKPIPQLSSFQSGYYSETLRLKVGTYRYDPSTKLWQIVVPDVEPSFEQMSRPNAPLLTYYAFKVAQKPQNEGNPSSDASLSHLKALGAAMRIFLEDFEERAVFDPEYMREALEPYVKDISVFFAPKSYEPYSFNSSLSGRLISAEVDYVKESAGSRYIANGKQTVMFYEGRNQKPVFRYGGKAAICFVDRHVALVSPEEAKNLIWNP